MIHAVFYVFPLSQSVTKSRPACPHQVGGGGGAVVFSHQPLMEGTCEHGTGRSFTVKFHLCKSLKYQIPIASTYIDKPEKSGCLIFLTVLYMVSDQQERPSCLLFKY